MISLPTLLAAEHLFSHAQIVTALASLFLLTQIVLAGFFLRRLAAFHRTIQRLLADLRGGGNGRRDIAAHGARFQWLRWVDENFPAGANTPGNYTRDDVFEELDTRIASGNDYHFLQRMGVMAPLLGVILTVLGFFYLDPPEDQEQSFGQIIQAVTPLVIGVGVGAALAIVNQLLLQFVGAKGERLRMDARTWFDSAIWCSVGLDTQAATVKAITAIERMADSISASAEKQHSTAQRMSAVTASIEKAGAEFERAVLAFSGGLSGLPETLVGLQDSTAATAKALQQLIPVGRRAVAGLDVSVAAFRSAIDQDFSEAARLCHSSLQEIAQATAGLKTTAAELKSGSQHLRVSVDEHAATIGSVNDSLTSLVVPAHQSLHVATDQLAGEVNLFRQLLAGMTEQLQTVSGELASVAGRLEPSVVSFHGAVEKHFVPAADRQHAALQGLAEGVKHLQAAAETMAKSTQAVQQLLAGQHHAVMQVAPAHDALRVATERIAEVSAGLKQSLDDELTPTQWAMRAAADSFGDSATQLAGFLKEGLAPTTERLVELHSTLAQLRGTVDALREFSQAGQNIERLNESLSQAAEISQAIAALPDQIRDILEQQAAAHADHHGSRGSILPWLRSKG